MRTNPADYDSAVAEVSLTCDRAVDSIDRQHGAQDLDLSIVIPTLNEAENVREIVRRLEATLTGISWELVFVDDDSPDGTAAAVREIARQNLRVRCLWRVGRRGLSSACIEGALASSAPFVAVMDADLQHDETLLPRMLDVLRRRDAEIVIGSRYMEGGSVGNWEANRLSVSRFATLLSRTVLRARLSDPMSGFFMARRDVIEGCVRDLSGISFKLLVDLFASSKNALRYIELPYVFRPRRAGASKLDTRAMWDFLLLLLDKLFGRWVPVRFLGFCIVGSIGVLVHLFVLSVLHRAAKVEFVLAQTAAIAVAMTSNFLLNNLLTYRDMRLRGWGLLRGWISFALTCSIGSAANVGVAAYVFGEQASWLVSALAGIIVGTVWNYAVTSVYTWKRAIA